MGIVVAMDPTTGEVLPMAAQSVRRAKQGAVVALDPTTGAVLGIR
jgi:cell division protein FtsI/penicillin-binding protein 2